MEETKDYIVARTIKSCDKHYWVESDSQDNNSELLSINCIHCPTGANIDPSKFVLIDGVVSES